MARTPAAWRGLEVLNVATFVNDQRSCLSNLTHLFLDFQDYHPGNESHGSYMPLNSSDLPFHKLAIWDSLAARWRGQRTALRPLPKVLGGNSRQYAGISKLQWYQDFMPGSLPLPLSWHLFPPLRIGTST